MASYLSDTYLWNTYAYVRLDMKNGEDIRYFKDLNAFNQSLYSTLPDPSLGYMDKTTGSNMFDVLKKFLKNTEYLCGSTVVIAAKRYPNEVEIGDLIAELQKNHVFVYIISSDTPSGGSNPSAMFNVATRTNGYCVFSTEPYLYRMYIDAENLAYAPNQNVASIFRVSGKGSQTIPFKIPGNQGKRDQVHFEVVYQDHKVDGSLISMNLTVTDKFGNEQPISEYFHMDACTDSHLFFGVNNTVQYYLNIDYEYQKGRQEVMVVRMNSDRYIPDNWLPFNE